MFAVLSKWLQGQHVVWPVVVSSIASTVFNIVCNYSFAVRPSLFTSLHTSIFSQITSRTSHSQRLVHPFIHSSFSGLCNLICKMSIFPIAGSRFWFRRRGTDIRVDAMVRLSISHCCHLAEKILFEVKEEVNT